MRKYYLKVQKIIGADKDYNQHAVLVRDGVIAAVTPHCDETVPCIDLGNVSIAPGMIDLHIHGREGCDVMDASMTSMETISKSLAQYGVTGFLATTVTSSWPETLAAMDILGEAAQKTMPGAQVLGGYSEGLFFTKDHKGAHNEGYFLDLTKERVDALIDAAQGQLRVLALAPEINNAYEMIEYIRSCGVKVMVGHTGATYEQTVCALEAGACGGVHVFNGMRGIHHREPGCTGAVLVHDTNVEVIADGVHLHPAILQMICRLKQPEQVTLISDCINAGGLADGAYMLGKTEIAVEDGIARTRGGSLAGSTLTLDRAAHNLSRLAKIPFRNAVHMASLSPALFLGMEDKLGSIAVGKQADLAVFDEAGEVVATLVKGKLAYAKSSIGALKDIEPLAV